MHNEAVVFASGKEKLQWFKFVMLKPYDQRNQFYLEKNIENCSMPPHLTIPHLHQ